MQEVIAKTLDAMRNLEDKPALKSALNDVFLALYAETERKYSALEQRVRDELPLVYLPYTVYCSVLPRTRIDAAHTYLSPMIADEIEDSGFSVKDITSMLGSRETPVIGTVFYEADYLKCRRLELDKQIFDGVFHVKSEQYPFKFRLSPAKRYEKLVESLYGIFVRNDVPWTTINCAYLNKFFDVQLIDMPKTPPPGTMIKQEHIRYSFAAYDSAIRQGLIPVWNIDRHRVKGEDFPMPALDKVNYEYRFDTGKLGADNGFLTDFDSAYIESVRREGSDVIAVSPQQRGLSWDIYRFRKRHDRAVDVYPYPVLSNARIDSFSARLTAAYGVHIKTKAELKKLIASFEAAEYVELETIRFAGHGAPDESYSMNPFLTSELRDPDYQKTLSLTFRAKNRDYFLSRDLMSFLVSQIQIVYPEYNCVGTLL